MAAGLRVVPAASPERMRSSAARSGDVFPDNVKSSSTAGEGEGFLWNSGRRKRAMDIVKQAA